MVYPLRVDHMMKLQSFFSSATSNTHRWLASSAFPSLEAHSKAVKPPRSVAFCPRSEGKKTQELADLST